MTERAATAKSHQTVFRVKAPRPVHSLDGGSDCCEPKDNAYSPRRAHKKSRGGCLRCKKRRIKCGEQQPVCERCIRCDLSCEYPTTDGSSTTNLVKDVGRSFVQQRWLEQPNKMLFSMSLKMASASLQELLLPGQSCSSPNTRSAMTACLRGLQHFETVTYSTLGGTLVQGVMQSAVAKIAWQHPFLMHLVLAVSAAHLKRLVPASSQPEHYREHALAETSHWSTALKLYQAELASPQKMAISNMDSIVGATFLITMFTSALEDEFPLDYFERADEEAMLRACNPIAASSGFTALRGEVVEVETSVWRPVLDDANDHSGTFTNYDPGIEGLPNAFVDLCDLDEKSTVKNNPYHGIVRSLAPLLKINGGISNFGKLIAFSGRNWVAFKPLVLRKDPRAMLLLAFWFALVSTIDQWWIIGRARSECAALMQYLSNVPDEKIQALLPFVTTLGVVGTDSLWRYTCMELLQMPVYDWLSPTGFDEGYFAAASMIPQIDLTDGSTCNVFQEDNTERELSNDCSSQL